MALVRRGILALISLRRTSDSPAAIVRSVSEAQGRTPTGSSSLSLWLPPELLGRLIPQLKETILQRSCAKRVSAPWICASRVGVDTFG